MLDRTGTLVISCQKKGYQVQIRGHNPSFINAFCITATSKRIKMVLGHSYSILMNSISCFTNLSRETETKFKSTAQIFKIGD